MGTAGYREAVSSVLTPKWAHSWVPGSKLGATLISRTGTWQEKQERAGPAGTIWHLVIGLSPCLIVMTFWEYDFLFSSSPKSLTISLLASSDSESYRVWDSGKAFPSLSPVIITQSRTMCHIQFRKLDIFCLKQLIFQGLLPTLILYRMSQMKIREGRGQSNLHVTAKGHIYMFMISAGFVNAISILHHT